MLGLDCNCSFLLKTSFMTIGALFVAYYALALLKFLYSSFLKGSTLLSYKKDKSWAVVTGATDGIGKAFVIELAKKGFNVLLVSRTEERLKDVIKKDLKDMSVSTAYVTMDFSKATNDDYGRLSKELEGKDVAVLINNVGVSYTYPEYYNDVSEESIQDLVKLNIESTNRVTKTILPIMIAQKRGLVLSTSSGSSLGEGCPLLSVYAATKAYINNWSVGLNHEYKSFNIRFESLTPFYVATKLSKIRKESLLQPGPTTYAKSALSTVGSYAVRCGYFPHEVISFVVRNGPTSLVLSKTEGMHKSIRRRYLEKYKKN